MEGQEMFKFKSRHTKHDLQNKVKEAITNSPSNNTPVSTPKRNKLLLKDNTATPKQVVNILKNSKYDYLFREEESLPF